MREAPEEYCLRTIFKMCHYLSVVRGREILSLNADFYMDDDGQIWLLYARDIVVRRKK
jgi:hypothetical protein